MPSIQNIADILKPVFDKHNVKKAILFGSFAKGTATENSDVDIYVDSGLRDLKFFGLPEDVIVCLKRDIDLIDSSQIDANSLMMNEISNTGVKIYG